MSYSNILKGFFSEGKFVRGALAPPVKVDNLIDTARYVAKGAR